MVFILEQYIGEYSELGEIAIYEDDNVYCVSIDGRYSCMQPTLKLCNCSEIQNAIKALLDRKWRILWK